MGNINTAFDADDTDLGDLLGDPNNVIQVQKKVKEMLSEHPLRQAGLRSEIFALGAHALPGVISATYVLSTELSSEKNQRFLGELMAELAHGNSAALQLLMDFGVADNPFPNSRAAVICAFSHLDAAAAVHASAARLSEAARIAVDDGDQQAARQIYELLLAHNLQADAAKEACEDWLAGNEDAKEAMRLFNSLLRAQPDRVEELIEDVLGVLNKKIDKANTDVKKLVRLPDPALIAPALRGANMILKTANSGRVKAVERFCEGAIAAAIKADPRVIEVGFGVVLSEGMQITLMRYWWQALSQAVKDECAEAKAAFECTLRDLPEEDDRLYGILQLIFLKNDWKKEAYKRWAEKLYSRYQSDMSSTVAQADKSYEMIKTGKQPIISAGAIRTNGNDGGLKSSKR